MNVLSTERLFFRRWREEDFELARRLWGSQAVMRFLGDALSDEKALDRMRLEIECDEKHGVQYWPFFETQTNDFVGCCGLRPWAYTNEDAYETGFALLEEKWGKGYALEAARAVIRHAFEELKVPMLRTGHHPDNVNSKKVLLKLGFTPAEPVFYKPTGLMHPTYSLRSKS